MVNLLVGLVLVAKCHRARCQDLHLFVLFVYDIEDRKCGNILKIAEILIFSVKLVMTITVKADFMKL